MSRREDPTTRPNEVAVESWRALRRREISSEPREARRLNPRGEAVADGLFARRRTFLAAGAAAVALPACRGCRPDGAPPPPRPAAAAPRSPPTWSLPSGVPNEAKVASNITSQCPYCGVGCGTLLQTDKGRVVGVKPDVSHPTNRGLQCIKGLTAAESLYVDRLSSPLIRKDLSDPLGGRASRTKGRLDAGVFRQASWDEALALVAHRIVALVKQHGGGSVGLYGSGQLPLEAQWLQAQLFKGVIGSGATEASVRLGVVAAWSALGEATGLEAPQASFDDLAATDMVVCWGHNPRSSHPVLFWRIAERKSVGKLPTLVVDPRRTGTVTALEQVSREASYHLQTVAGDVALCNAIAHVIVTEHPEAIDEGALERHTAGWRAYLDGCKARYAPEAVVALTGVSAARVREAAAAWAAASIAGRKRGRGGVLCFWGSGINQSLFGQHAGLSLINLLALTGNVDRPGCGPLPMQGQANAAGVGLVGGLTGRLPFYQRLGDVAARRRIAQAWRVPAERLAPAAANFKDDGQLVGMLERAHSGELKALLMMGASHVALPDTERLVRPALTRAFTVVSEIYRHAPNLLYADVVLPAACWGEWVGGTFVQSERRINLCEGTANPLPGTKPDLDIVIELGRRVAKGLGLDAAQLYPYKPLANGLHDPEAVFAEIVAASRESSVDLGGMLEVQRRDKLGLYDQLRARRGFTWPAPTYAAAKAGGAPGPLFGARSGKPWPTASGKIQLRLCEQTAAGPRQREAVAKLAQAGVRRAFRASAEPELLALARDAGLTPERPDLAQRGKPWDEIPADRYPFWLGLGVVYEHFHAAKTHRAPTLRELCDEQYVELHPADALALGIRDGERVRVVTRRGSFEGRAAVGASSVVKPARNAVPQGYLFSPWPMSVADEVDPRDNRWLVNAASHRAFDPTSGQPALKHLVARIEKVKPRRGTRG